MGKWEKIAIDIRWAFIYNASLKGRVFRIEFCLKFETQHPVFNCTQLSTIMEVTLVSTLSSP
jgi:hypothetical protein